MTYNRRIVNEISVTAGDILPLNEVKSYLRVDGDADDELILGFIDAAIGSAEKYMGRSIRQKVLDSVMDGFPSAYDHDALDRLGPGSHTISLAVFTNGTREIDLAYGPVSAITSITTYDRDNTSAVLTSAAYFLNGDRVTLNDGYSWPADLRRRASVVVRYSVGWGASLPAMVRVALMQHISAMYDCRMGCDAPEGCKALLQPFRVMDMLAW